MKSPENVSSEYPAAFLSLSAYYGVTQYLEPYIDGEIFEVLSDDQTKRAKSAINERMSVIPRTKGMYWVISYTDDEPNKYSINYEGSSCTCGDYLYNCDPETGLVCKHLWRVRYLVSQDALPSKNENPYNWLLIHLDKDLRFYLSKQRQSLYEEALELREKVGEESSHSINYWWAYRRRAEILSKLPETGDMTVFEQTPKMIEPSSTVQTK